MALRFTLRRAQGLAVAAVAVSIALVAQGGVVTNATWNDTEWDSGRTATVACNAAAGAFTSRGEGRALSGSLFSINLDTLAQSAGPRITNNGAAVNASPAGVNPVPGVPDAFADPLNVTALSAVNLNLGQGILKLPLNTSTGAVGQFGQARSSGIAAGASGFVTETGGIGLRPTTGYPELATLQLSQLLVSVNPGVSNALANVSDVSLTAGAVAGRATLDGCASAWSGDLASGLIREYLASSLRLNLTSPTVGTLVTGVQNTVNQLETTVNGLTSNAGVISAITSGVTSLLNGVLSGPNGSSLVQLGSVTTQVRSASINLTAVRSLLTTPVADSGGVLTVNLSTGQVQVDTTALLQAAYPGSYSQGLNGLPPNTNLLADPAILTALTAALTAALSGWLTSVSTALNAAINAILLDVSVTINLKIQAVLVVLPVWVEIGHIAASATGTLGNLTSSTSLVLLPGLGTIVSGLVSGVLAPVLNLLLSTLLGGLGGIVSGAVNGVVNTFRALPIVVTALATPVITAISTAYNVLFLSGVVAITVNAQNDPVPGVPAPKPEPADWASLPLGQFDVAALRIGVLDALGQSSVRLYLGRGSVGPGCSVASANPGRCASYVPAL